MNPWNRAEMESAEEKEERDLFARRARALAPGEVAPLASVLRAARANRDLAERGGAPAPGARARAVVALALAAACMTAAVTRLPGRRGSRIAADVEGSASPARATGVATHPGATLSSPSPEPARHFSSAVAPASGVSCGSSEDVSASEEMTCVSPTIFGSTSPSVTLMTTVLPRPAPLASRVSRPSLTCDEDE